MRLRSLALGTGLALLTVAAQAAIATHPGQPDVSHVRVSPDGQRVVMLRPIDGALQPFVGDLRSSKGTVPVKLNPVRQLITGCDWASNDRLVCSFIKYYRRDGKAAKFPGGFPARGTRLVRLLAVDVDGGNLVELVPRAAQPARFPAAALINSGLAPGEVILREDRRFRPTSEVLPSHEWEHRILSFLPDDPDHILVSLPRQVLFVFDVYRLNIHDNTMTQTVGPHWLVTAFWSADESGRVRIAVGTDFRGESYGHPVILARDGDGEFKRVDASHLGTTWYPPRVLGYSGNGSSAYVEAHTDQGRVVAWQVNATTLAMERLIADGDPYDVSLTPIRGTECGIVGFHDANSGSAYWLNGAFRDAAATLEANLPGVIANIPSMSRDCSRLVVVTRGGGRTPTTYLHDRESGTTRRIGASWPNLDEHLAATRPWSYESSDGYSVDALLTVPRDAKPGPQPLIVMPVTAVPRAPAYEPWVELLAAQGYVVLRPAVRGTVGRGDAHWKAGFGVWGRRIQDDLAAGVAALVQDGIAAPNRICYVGRGRGGYLALVGAFGTESQARCAATFAYDEPMHTLFDYSTARRDWMWHHWLDMPERFWTDASPISGRPLLASESSSARSPLLTAEHTGIPVLIARGGAGEPRLEEFRKGSKRFEKAVLEAGELAYSTRRHGGPQEADFLRALEDFLRRNLHDGE